MNKRNKILNVQYNVLKNLTLNIIGNTTYLIMFSIKLCIRNWTKLCWLTETRLYLIILLDSFKVSIFELNEIVCKRFYLTETESILLLRL